MARSPPALQVLLPVLLSVVLCAAPSAVAVQVFGVDTDVTVRPGGEAVLQWELEAGDTSQRFVATVDAPVEADWRLDVTPERGRIAPGETVALTVTARPGGDPQPRTLPITLHVVEEATGESTTASGTVRGEGFGMVFGRYDNPLPPPLDGVAGTFLLNIAAWLVVGVVAMVLVNPVLRLATMRTKTTLDDRIIQIVARPAFLLVFAYGVRQSLRLLRLPAWTFSVIDVLWLLLWVAVLVYAGWRLWHEILLAWGRRMASRTESTLDDRLLPVLEKMGGIIIVLVGFFHLADGFGWNMAWLAAGGAIGGLVVAFAAQDTLANFFAGVHLLLDRPFTEGDDIILDTGEVCTVRKIGLRSTDLYHVANHEVIIVPNSLLAKNRVINILQPDNLYKVRVEVGVAYGTDVQKVKQILMEIGRGHPLSLDEGGHEPFVRFNAFGASSLDFSLTVWVADVYARYAVASDLREMVEQRLAEEAIEIPFPQRVVWQGREEADRPAEKRGRKRLKLHGSIEEARKDQAPEAHPEEGDAAA